MISTELANSRKQKLAQRKRKQLILVSCLIVALLAALVTMPSTSEEPMVDSLQIVTPVSIGNSVTNPVSTSQPGQRNEAQPTNDDRLAEPSDPLASYSMDEILAHPLFASTPDPTPDPTIAANPLTPQPAAPRAVYGRGDRKSVLWDNQIVPAL